MNQYKFNIGITIVERELILGFNRIVQLNH